MGGLVVANLINTYCTQGKGHLQTLITSALWSTCVHIHTINATINCVVGTSGGC